jgi:hypothetical protein
MERDRRGKEKVTSSQRMTPDFRACCMLEEPASSSLPVRSLIHAHTCSSSLPCAEIEGSYFILRIHPLFGSGHVRTFCTAHLHT